MHFLEVYLHSVGNDGELGVTGQTTAYLLLP